jgi:SAM-dependent methyltransferase
VASRSEQLVHRILPPRARRALKGPIRAVERQLLVGDRLWCPICDGRFRRFLSRHGHADQQCPACQSLVRHRAMWLFLAREVGIERRRLRILHFAPEAGIAARIRATGADYVTGDLDAALASERIDVTAIPYPDASFDVVICSHVLEHVPDDRRAIAELARVVRPDGMALVVVPIKRATTVEYLDPSPHPLYPDGYLRTGAHGHVRVIGSDYTERLTAVGLQVEVIDYAASLTAEERATHAIEQGEWFFVCRPRPADQSGTAAAANAAIEG